MRLRAVILLVGVGLCHYRACAATGCTDPKLSDQRRDSATIWRLERAWTIAFLTGDTKLESCLLTPDFTEIMSDGHINHLKDELELAERNKGKTATDPAIPPMSINLRGDVAVAYYIPLSEKIIDGKAHKSYFADYFVWENDEWHVYFAQQTSFAK